MKKVNNLCLKGKRARKNKRKSLMDSAYKNVDFDFAMCYANFCHNWVYFKKLK